MEAVSGWSQNRSTSGQRSVEEPSSLPKRLFDLSKIAKPNHVTDHQATNYDNPEPKVPWGWDWSEC